MYTCAAVVALLLGLVRTVLSLVVVCVFAPFVYIKAMHILAIQCSFWPLSDVTSLQF
jgi:hypothetical protein